MARLYCLGPMSKYADSGYNYDAFHTAARRFRAAGWEVDNPAEHHGGRTDLPYETYMSAAIESLSHPDLVAVAALPEWEESNGALMEMYLAQRRGLQIFHAETMGKLIVPKLRVVLTDDPYDPPHRYAQPAPSAEVRP